MTELKLKRMPDKIRTKLQHQAEAEGKSIEDYVLQVLKERVKTEEILGNIKPVRLKGKSAVTLKMLKKARQRGRL